MIAKRQCYCTETTRTVQAVVEEARKGRGKDAEVRYSFLKCLGSADCSKATFCRFVNPLTVRNPLEIQAPEPA
jgi:hypothetical protein